MQTRKRKIRKAVIETVLIQLNDIRFQPLVF